MAAATHTVLKAPAIARTTGIARSLASPLCQNCDRRLRREGEARAVLHIRSAESMPGRDISLARAVNQNQGPPAESKRDDALSFGLA